MKYEVIISDGAADGFLEILAYLNANNWHKAAEKLSNSFVSVLDSLSEFPFQFPIAATDLGLRKFVLLGKTVVLYRVLEQKVVVIAVFDGRRSLPNR